MKTNGKGCANLIDRPVAGGSSHATAYPLGLTVTEWEDRNLIVRAIRKHNGDVKASAKWLGVSRATIYKKRDRYKITTEDFPGGWFPGWN